MSRDPRSQNADSTDCVKESKLDVLQSQLDKFKMKYGEGVAEMYDAA